MGLLSVLTDRKKRFAAAAYLSSAGNVLLAVGKFCVGLVTGSFFWCVSALYGAVLGLCRAICARVHGKYYSKGAPSREGQSRAGAAYTLIGLLLFVAGVLYAVYSVSIVGSPESYDIGRIPAIAVAAVTFLEIALSFRGMRLMRRDYDIMLEALKTVGLAAALDNLIVVQAALTATSGGGGYADWMGVTSAVVIAPAMILGLYMVVRMARVRNGSYARSMLREAEKIAGKCGSGVRILGFDDDFVLPLRLLYESDGAPEDDLFAELCGRRLRVETECLGRIKRL